MTAEIAILNTSAVALAADSAVTLDDGENSKVFTSANKIFRLSKKAPIAVMIYGKIDFMGIPWETLIKLFRNKRGDIAYNKVIDCANDFISFLLSEGSPPDNLIQYYLAARIKSTVLDISNSFFTISQEILYSNGSISESDLKKMISFCMDSLEKEYEGTIFTESSETAFRIFRSKCSDFINKAIVDDFGDLAHKIDKARLNRILKARLFGSKLKSEDYTGLVFTGFGDDELLPSIHTVNIEHLLFGYMKKDEMDSANIGTDASAMVMPFAQSDMVHRFMAGVDNRFINHFVEIVSQLIRENNQIIINSIFHSDEEKASKILNVSEDAISILSKKFIEEIKDFTRQDHEPITEFIQYLPKEDMASLASSLINIMTSRRKISFGAETVSGPIDVALITKGDGLIWINRKHYFDKDFNYDFFQNR